MSRSDTILLAFAVYAVLVAGLMIWLRSITRVNRRYDEQRQEAQAEARLYPADRERVGL